MRSISAALVLVFAATTGCADDLSKESLAKSLAADLAAADERLAADADDQSSLLARGDALFFLGRFDEAVAAYDRIIALNPEQAATHWQRGLALYFAGRFDDSAKQFERFYERDKVDRENGIWRFYAQVRGHGLASARESLLPYEQPDRVPLGVVYRLCGGEAQPEDVLAAAEGNGATGPRREMQRFYANLYVGLHHAIVTHDATAAKHHLTRAVGNDQPRQSGYGPNFMWHVARLSLERAGSPESRGERPEQ